MDLCCLAEGIKGKLMRLSSIWLCRERGAAGKWDWVWMHVCGTYLIYTQRWHICPCAPLTVYILTGCHGRWHGAPDDDWFLQLRSQIPPPLDQQKGGFKSKWMSFWDFNDVFPNIMWVQDFSKLYLKKKPIENHWKEKLQHMPPQHLLTFLEVYFNVQVSMFFAVSLRHLKPWGFFFSTKSQRL